MAVILHRSTPPRRGRPLLWPARGPALSLSLGLAIGCAAGAPGPTSTAAGPSSAPTAGETEPSSVGSATIAPSTAPSAPTATATATATAPTASATAVASAVAPAPSASSAPTAASSAVAKRAGPSLPASAVPAPSVLLLPGAPDGAHAVVNEAGMRLRECYAQLIASDPTAHGTVSAEIATKPNGTVAREPSAKGVDASLSSCVARALATLSFSPTAKGATFTVRLMFHAPPMGDECKVDDDCAIGFTSCCHTPFVYPVAHPPEPQPKPPPGACGCANTSGGFARATCELGFCRAR